MRFYNHSGRSVRRFIFDRPETPESPESPAPANASVPPKAADLDNPYGRYYSKARSREDLRRGRQS